MFNQHSPIQLNKITVNYDGTDILRDLSVKLSYGQKVGLVGVNGSGKTTLLKVIKGGVKPVQGSVETLDPQHIGYLQQSLELEKEATVFEIVSKGIEKVIQAKNRYEYLISQYDHNDNVLVEETVKLQDFLTYTNGWNIDIEIEKVLAGLELDKSIDEKVKNLSGGERMRLSLAKILISNPQLLILDEPTNHLDIKTRTWVEKFINNFEGTVLIVSHDRNFLDKTTNKTWLLRGGRITEYGGNYSFYANQKEREEKKAIEEYDKLKRQKSKVDKKYHVQQESMHKRKKYGDKDDNDVAILVGGRKDSSEKFRGKKLAEVRDEKQKIDEQLQGKKPEKEINFRFELNTRKKHGASNPLIALNGATLGYKDIKVLEGINLEIYFGNRIGLFGRNGSGKTTLINSLVNQNLVLNGSVWKSPNINIGYLDQHQNLLNWDLTVEENIKLYMSGKSHIAIRSLLSQFLFRKTTEISKKAKNLSGGEKTRLSLALIAIQNPDVLILDEPTNNLDIASIETMSKVLKDFPGALLVVSHDLAFLKEIKLQHAYLINKYSLKQMKYLPDHEELFEKELLEGM